MFFYSRRFLILILLCLTGAIGFIGYQAYHQQLASAESAMQEQIRLIGDLKALEITQWLKERHGDVKTLSHSFALTEDLERFLTDPDSAEQRHLVLTWLQTLRNGYDYAAVALVDSQGRVLLSVPETEQTLGPQTQSLVQRALISRDVIFSDLYRVSDESTALGPPLRLDFIAPLQSGSELNNDLGWALLLRVDPQDFLFPLLQFWPTPNLTAEALLVRRNGNTLTFLSPLRHHPAAPLSFSLPLTTPELIAAQSFLQGGAQEVKGVDYRGEPVLASFRPILDSHWHLVAKVDQREVNQWIQQHTDSVLPQVLLGLLITGSAIGLLWRRQSRVALERRASELENQVQARTADLMAEIERHKESEQGLRRERNRAQQYLDIVQVAIVVLDPRGRVLLLNQTGCEQLGYSEMDILDRNWFETVIPESDRARTLEGFQRLLRQRPGMTDFFENRVRTRDGQERLYAWHNKVLTTAAGTLVGTISAGEDITERRSLEQAVRESEAKLRAFFDSNAVGMLFGDIQGHIFDTNERLLEIIGYSREDLEVGRLRWTNLTPPEFLPIDEIHIAEARERGACTPYEKQYIRKDGSRIWILVGYVLIEPEREQSVAFIIDLTQPKQAEEALRDSETRFRRVVEEAPFPILIHAEDGEILAVNRTWTEITGYTHADIPTIAAWTQLAYGQEDQAVRADIDLLYTLDRRKAEGIYCITCRDGSQRMWDFSSTPLGCLPDGRHAVISMAGDVTELIHTTERLRAATERQQALLEASPLVIMELDPEGRVTYWNRAAERILGWRADETVGQLLPYVPTDKQDETRQLQERVLQGEILQGIEVQRQKKDGTLIDVRIYAAPIHDNQGDISGIVAIVEDISERHQAEEKLRLSAAVIQSIRDGVVVTDLTPRIVFVNPSFMEITGYTEAELLSQNPSMFQSGRQDRAFYRELWASLLQTGHWEGEMWNRRKDGEIYPEWLSISTVRNEYNEPIYYVGISTDITQLKQNQTQLERLAHYDVLTKLPNRLLAMARLAHVCERAKRHTLQFAVLYLDLDRFKTVNDSLGHPVGNELLVAVARRLRHRLRAEDTLARLGGDEFLVLLEEIAHPKDVEVVAQEIIAQLQQPFHLADKQPIYVSVSIGISIFPDDAGGIDEMIRNADAAMYLAKGQGRNTYRFYTESLTQAAKARLELESRLRDGLERDEFIVYYQPLMSLLTNRLVGAEALVRWQPSGQAPIPPGRFIPIAEETGLIVPLGEWVLRTAVTQAKTWMEAGLPDLTMAVNVSVQQLRRQDFPQLVSEVLTDSGLPPVHLELELTESGLMEQGERALTILQALKALGVKLAIDDFGTGYSSLAYLKRFPIDKLKIDREFIRDLPEDSNDAEIAATIVAMTRHLHLEVLAEGIETEEQLAFLKARNCSLGQGYLFSPPVTADDFSRYAADLLKKWQ